MKVNKYIFNTQVKKGVYKLSYKSIMIKFTKMQGAGNDYIYINVMEQKIDNLNELSKKMSDRHFGIGSDGIILIDKSDVADFKMRIFNSDGSEAEMCGNGIRCVGKYVYDKGLTKKDILKIETNAGIKELKLNIENGKVKTAEVDMGEPILEADKIPVISSENPVKDLEIEAEGRRFKFTCISMGNPHAITFVDDVDNFDIEKYGKLIEVNKLFPHRTNVEFAEIVDKSNIKMRVWERGAGETLACGTGSCATAVAANINGLTNRKVNIKLLGGTLNINWNEKNNHVYMTGPAETICEGIWEKA